MSKGFDLFLADLAQYPAEKSIILGLGAADSDIPTRDYAAVAGEVQARVSVTPPPPRATEQKIVNAPKSYLNVRVETNTSKPPVGRLEDRAPVVVYAQDAVTGWAEIAEGAHKGRFVSRGFLVNPKPPTPTVRTRHVGWHICAEGGLTSQALETMRRLSSAGHPVPGITCLDVSTPAQVKAASPKTLVGLRNWPDQPDAQGYLDDPDGWYSRQMTALRGVPGVDYYILSNEWGRDFLLTEAGCKKLYAFWDRIMDRAIADKIKITIFDFAVGWMSDERMKGEYNSFAALKPLLQKAAANGFPINYHAYAGPQAVYNPSDGAEWFAGRWVKWLQEVPGLLLWGGEAGPYDGKDEMGQDAHYRNPSDSLFQWNALDQIVNLSGVGERVLCLCHWALAQWGQWRRFDFSEALPAYEMYMM